MPESDGINWDLFIGRELANVTLVRELGRGMMGIVFVGFQKSLKRQVAVKVLHKSKVRNVAAWQSFRDEGEALAVLNHPNIVPIYEMGQADDCYFQVMQLVDGSDLRSIIKKGLKHPIPAKRIIPLPETLDIMINTLDGLGFAHEGGVIHQDIKPANILIESRGKRPLIADFGIARIIEAEYSSEGKIVGTPLYMSPEQAGGKQVDARTDIYSMGVILFEMLAGLLPVKEESVVDIIERKKFAPETFFTALPRQVSGTIDEDLERAILKATDPNSARRYSRCEDFMHDLKRYRQSASFLSRNPEGRTP
jgi:eukaryotic-like serine/threonine-protein kinase